jgi:4-amino-4-deoxy-L-arabinose transferase-like glycosyltransferase
MEENVKKTAFLFALAIISFLGYRLRIANYSQIPLPGESQDEYSFSWVGLSLIRAGYPIGISGIEGYPNYDYRYINVDRIFQNTAAGNPQMINSPWFDHPPVLGLITGGFAYLKGARVFEDTGVFLIRKPMIMIGSLAVVLIFLVALRLYGSFLTALITALIYSTSPLIVVSSRMVQAENAIVIPLMLSLWFIFSYRKTGKELWLWLAAISSGSATLFKLSALFIFTANALYLLITSKDKKQYLHEIAIIMAVTLSFLSLFFIYGIIYDFRTFTNILKSNSQRFYGIGPNAIFTLITTSKITNLKYLTDGWLLAGWISYMLLFLKHRIVGRKLQGYDLLLISYITSFLATYIFFGSEHYGWYRIPSYPLLIISLARMIYLSIQKTEYFLIGLFLLLLPIGVGISKIVSIEEFQKYALLWRWGWFIIIIFGIIMKKKNLQKSHPVISRISNIVIIALFLVSIHLNIKEFFFINITSHWYSSN